MLKIALWTLPFSRWQNCKRTTTFDSYARRGADTLYYLYHGDSLDHISLTPNEVAPPIINSMMTFSVRFRTKTGIGIGSTIKEIMESGEHCSIQKKETSEKPFLFFPEYNLIGNLDQNTIALFLHSDTPYEIENLRADGFITYLQMEE